MTKALFDIARIRLRPGLEKRVLSMRPQASQQGSRWLRSQPVEELASSGQSQITRVRLSLWGGVVNLDAVRKVFRCHEGVPCESVMNSYSLVQSLDISWIPDIYFFAGNPETKTVEIYMQDLSHLVNAYHCPRDQRPKCLDRMLEMLSEMLDRDLLYWDPAAENFLVNETYDLDSLMLIDLDRVVSVAVDSALNQGSLNGGGRTSVFPLRPNRQTAIGSGLGTEAGLPTC